MDKIQIKNVRSLKDTGEVSLSPITLLVGENSSGKSTFLRLFPLLKQSITKRTDGPLLWAGDVDDYVDFGSFSETVTNDGSEDMTFCFSFKTPATDIVTSDLLWRIDQCHDITYSITIEQKNNREYISKVNVNINNSKFSFDTRKQIVVDRTVIMSRAEKAIHPVYGLDRVKSEVFGYSLPSISDVIDEVFREFIDEEITEDVITVGFMAINRRRYLIQCLQIIGELLCLNTPWRIIKKELHAEPKSVYKEIITHIEKMSSRKVATLFTYSKLIFFYIYFTNIEEYLSSYLRQVHYIAPLRATAERYYRLRNLAIDEVDYQGKNLAIFLNSLSDKRLHSFQMWTQEYFGFQIKVGRSEGHLSLLLALADGKNPVNLSDTGFGYSQLLPIITQLWDLSTSPRSQQHNHGAPLVIAIEQPELHLHPALQAKLAKAFLASIDVAKKNGYLLQLLIETHSETIVNYFGTAIARGTLKSDDVSVMLFDKSPEDLYTEVRMSRYDKDGYLSDWPIGFFSPKEW